jgi:outer membrane protein assembly factor BamE (lipoprotein component of BamABCDE complex)
MGRLIPAGGIILIMLILPSCASWPDTYLKTATNYSTQDEVAKSLGPPHLTRELSTGESVWSYGFTNTTGVIGCTTYLLTFDREHILRSWQWQPSCPQSFRP